MMGGVSAMCRGKSREGERMARRNLGVGRRTRMQVLLAKQSRAGPRSGSHCCGERDTDCRRDGEQRKAARLRRLLNQGAGWHWCTGAVGSFSS